MRKNSVYEENGVFISKKTLKLGDSVKLVYKGLLKNSGASRVHAHIGYNDNWESCATLEMDAVGDEFVIDIDMLKAGTFNCAFVDPAGNWDNNSGANYSFKVAGGAKSNTGVAGRRRKAQTEEVKSPETKTARAGKAKKEKVEENGKKTIKSA